MKKYQILISFCTITVSYVITKYFIEIAGRKTELSIEENKNIDLDNALAEANEENEWV